MMNVKRIRDIIISLRGRSVVLIYYGSRNRKERYNGLIYKTYNNVFSILLPNGDIKCFSYIDILTNTVKIIK